MRTTRRALLGAGAGAALAVAGCGDRTEAPVAGGDGAVLAELLAIEHELVRAWDVAVALPGAEGAAARSILAQERAHVAALEAAVPSAGRVPRDVTAAAGELREHAGAGDGTAAFDAAARLESAVGQAYLSALGRLTGERERELALGLWADEAAHGSVVLATLGRDPIPDAFAGTLAA